MIDASHEDLSRNPKETASLIHPASPAPAAPPPTAVRNVDGNASGLLDISLENDFRMKQFLCSGNWFLHRLRHLSLSENSFIFCDCDHNHRRIPKFVAHLLQTRIREDPPETHLGSLQWSSKPKLFVSVSRDPTMATDACRVICDWTLAGRSMIFRSRGKTFSVSLFPPSHYHTSS